MKKSLILALSCLLAVQCGYRLRGTGSFLPSQIKRISIPLFKNYTTRYELDLKLTQSVINEFIARGKVEVLTDSGDADAILMGEILSFNVQPIAFSGQATADSYNIIIVAKIVLRDVASERDIYSNPSYVYQEEYKVAQGADFESLETEALNRVAEKFARNLVVNILEGF